MTRQDFKKVIKLMSMWTIDKRKGNYRLPSGTPIKTYLFDLVDEFLTNNKMEIAKNGNVYKTFQNTIYIPFGEDEEMPTSDEHDKRIRMMVNDLIY